MFSVKKVYDKILVFKYKGSLVAQQGRICLSLQDTEVQSLGLEDPWRKKWQPTPVFLPGTMKSYGQRSLAMQK